MANERQTMIRLREQSKDLNHTLDSYVKGLATRKAVAEDFAHLVATMAELCQTEDGRVMDDLIQAAVRDMAPSATIPE